MSFKCLTPLGPFGKSLTGITKKLSLCLCRNINPPCYVKSLWSYFKIFISRAPAWAFQSGLRAEDPRLRILFQIPLWLSMLAWRDDTMPGVPGPTHCEWGWLLWWDLNPCCSKECQPGLSQFFLWFFTCSQRIVVKEESHWTSGFSPQGCWEMNGEGGLVLLSRAALAKERLGTIIWSLQPSLVQCWVRKSSVYWPGSKLLKLTYEPEGFFHPSIFWRTVHLSFFSFFLSFFPPHIIELYSLWTSSVSH